MSDNIKVVVKVRPLISREIDDKLSYQWKVINNTLYQLDANGKESGVQYTFDKVYDVTTKTADVYKDVAKPIVEAAIAGFNGTIFAYGQTSSGKTYTMSGTDTSPGIIQLAVLNLFEQIKCIPDRDFLVRVSYIEIYNETLKDLLNCDNEKIKIRESLQGVKVETTEKFTSSPKEVLDIMREGEANRQTGATNMNEESSRSHSIFQITIESREHTEGEETAGCVNVSQLNLVDLAGSERAGQTGATGKRFKEGTHINKSLSVLALVIKQLSEGPHKHANYRDSKLTRILQNSLGGNAKTSIICAVTPAAVEETISTLQFANRAKAIKNKPEVNAVATDATKLQDLTKQLSKLQSELATKHHIEQDNRLLMKQIENLQKMILNGFGQTSFDMGGARRKTWCAPRRMTISTSSLRSVVEHEETAVERFCTPNLKYNPLALPTPREFRPIQRASQLPPVSEERSMVTPPPKNKKVNFNDEIIDLDSDDDNASNTSHCSPYHKCYNATKTPPCVLRKKAKIAEKDLKDIVELTKREKMYNPEVVEYMEKLEQSTNRIAKLEDEIKSLNTTNMEKDSQVDLLKDKIAQTKQEVQTFSSAKVELEAQCKEYNTKLTDLEVSYETLKTKFKLREDELLSLINEQSNNKKAKESSKSLSRTFEKDFGDFMDMSKDISLVSDNDSSIDSSNNKPAGHLQRLVEEMRTDATAKNETIAKLETDLLHQKLTIESLEDACMELRDQIKKTNSMLQYTENENCLLKSSIETLNSTIKSQKENLESAHNEIQSYDIVIKELQAKLGDKKYDDVHISINDISLEKMIDNEEKFIANNENMRNIIYSLKNAIESRNKEIEQLKSNQTSDTELLAKKLEEKELQIIQLIEEAEKSKEIILQNMDVISTLIAENKSLINNTDDLTGKLNNDEKQTSELEKRVLELEKDNNEYANQLQTFNENHEKLLNNLSDFKENLSIVQKEKEALLELQQEVISRDNLIGDLKSEISTKDSLISTLSSDQIESQNFLCKWKSTVTRVQQILSSYVTDTSEQEELYDASSFDELCDQLNSVEKTAKVIAIQKEEAEVSNIRLREEIEELKSRVESLIQVKNKVDSEKENQNQHVIQLNKDLEEIRRELFELNKQNASLDAKLQLATESRDKLNHEILDKENMITSIRNEANNLRLQLDTILKQEAGSRSEIKNLQSTFKSNQDKFEEMLQTKRDEIEDLKNEYAKKVNILEENLVVSQRHSETLEKTICDQDQHLENIYKAAVSLLQKLDRQNDEHQSQNDIHTNVYSNIISILEQATNDIVLLKSSNEINNSEEIKETIELVDVLKEQNQQLISKLSYTEDENSDLTAELEKIKMYNKKIFEDLLKSDGTLKQLHDELYEKLHTIENLESKITEWKNNFCALEETMKQQLLELQISNRVLESQSQTSMNKSLSIKINEPCSIGSKLTDSENDQRQTTQMDRSLSNVLAEPENYSPQSLLTLCCNRIIDAIQPSEIDLDSSSSNTNFATSSAETQTHACDCERLLTEREMAVDENLELKAKIAHLQSVNIDLLKEQEEIRKELKLLMEPAHELQKKISSHKTNLSTLSATTYAENKLLKSQVKVLQHHNNRVYNVCQRDLPEFKKSLQELSCILKSTTLANRLEANIKRLSLPEVLDRNSSEFKDDSTLDGDLLMLDTNVTIASVDNTLLAQDQTCLDGTQIYLETEINTDVIKTIDPNILHTQLQMLAVENEKLTEKLTMVRAENCTLQEKIGKLSESIPSDIRVIDAQNSPMKFNSSMNEISQETTENNHSETSHLCEHCINCNNPSTHEKMSAEINQLTQEFIQIQQQNSDLEKRCNTLKDHILANDSLALNFSTLEKDNKKQLILIDQLTKKLSARNEDFIKLQEENDNLSTQIMEIIGETDDLRKEVDTLKEDNKALSVKCGDLEDLIKGNSVACFRCAHNTCSPNNPEKTKSVLNRSRSDSDSSSPCNKLSTLQNELLAGREDCRTISEDVATIKNHFERGDLSMDLDDSMGEPNVFAFTKELHLASPKPNKCKLVTELPEERMIDTYDLDKAECFNYYKEKTGADNNFSKESRIIEAMKMFYNNLVVKHGNEVENLVNKLKDFEESRGQLHDKINQVNLEYSQINEEIKVKDKHIDSIANTLRQIRNNINDMNVEICSDGDKNSVIVTMFKNNILSILDKDFDLSSVNTFEILIDKVVNKHKNDLVEIMDRYSELQRHMEILTSELSNVTENLNEMKCQLSEKEKEYNLLKAQKEKVHEITSAVTRDIVQREKELTKIISNSCQKLIERNILTQYDIDTNWPLDKQMSILIEKLIDQSCQNDLALQEKHNLALEITKYKTILEEKDEELESLKSEAGQLRELCRNATNELQIKNEALEALKSLNHELDEVYKRKVQENEANARLIENMTQELDILKATVNEKDSLLQTIKDQNSERNSDESESKAKVAELMESINSLEHENKNLKSVNDMLTKENEEYALQLAQTKYETILEEKDEELESLKSEAGQLRELCRNATNELQIKNEALEALKSLNHELDEVYKRKVQENEANARLIENMTQELDILKATVNEKDSLLQTIKDQNSERNSDESESKAKVAELMESINSLEHENKNLKSVNDMLTKENEEYALQLAQTKYETILEEKDEELESMKSEAGQLRELCINATNELQIKNEALEALKLLHDELDEVYKRKVEENEANARLIENMTQELDILKATVNEKDSLLQRIKDQNSERNSDESESKAKVTELMESINSLEHENKNLKSVNDMLTKESEEYAVQLAQTKYETILEKKDEELESIKSEAGQLRELCRNATNELQIKNEAFEALKSLHDALDEVYKRKVEENEVNARLIENMTQELDILKATVNEKDNLLQTIKDQISERNSDESESKAKVAELMESINSLEHVNKNLKSVNDMLTKESEEYAVQLAQTKYATILEEKDQELASIKSEAGQLRELCRNATNELQIKNEALEALKSLHDELDEVYKRKVEENEANARLIENMTQELDILKATVNEKDSLLQRIKDQNSERNSDESESKAKVAELMESINSLEHENKNLKSVNDMITKESVENAVQLAQADDTIKKNKTELDKLTTEIITLNQSLKESMGVIENLKAEAKSLLEQNVAVKRQFEEANELCSQLKLNMKTHEKTAEIQCKIISRLKQENETRVSLDSGKESELKELTQKCESLQKELAQLAEDKDKLQQEAQELREAKESLERLVSQSEGTPSARALASQGAGDARRRRRSLLDSKRDLDDQPEPDHKNIEVDMSTQDTPDDMLMDVDEHSNRSTPARNTRSDSFQSRHEEGEESRPGSAQARRQRRQSLHDQHRATHRARDHMNSLNEITKTNGGDHDSEVASLKDRLTLCQQELQELQERYREVDEECETCAEYLRERDQQCMQLKAENKDLQQQIAKLNDKLQNASIVRGQKAAQRSFANASVNTDEDWANLHSVVVDRMSYDREVERNRALQRSADELRYNNGELKTALARARKASERAQIHKANLQELEATRLELEACKRELEECKERCMELDEECETCGEYLRERDEQLCRLKEAKDALQAKLEEVENKEAGSKVQSVRKKRQSMHDQNRDSAVQSKDASTDTAGDLHTESDNSKLVNESLLNNEIIQLKMALEAVSRQKQALEMQLRASALLPPVYVATGSAIVQNQHLTEVMKENQKLKRMNAKLITICKKRGKPLSESNQENDDPADMG